MTSPATLPVGETSTLISLPGGLASVLVLNFSGGIADVVGAPDVIVNVGSAASVTPQVGIRLHPGEAFSFPLELSSNGVQQPLFAIASGPSAQIQVTLGEGW